MTICSLVIHARPGSVTPVAATLHQMEGVEVHAQTEEGRLVVSIDHPDRAYCSDAIMRMHNVDGVINAALIYEYHEESEPTHMEVSK